MITWFWKVFVFKKGNRENWKSQMLYASMICEWKTLSIFIIMVFEYNYAIRIKFKFILENFYKKSILFGNLRKTDNVYFSYKRVFQNIFYG